MKHATTTRPIDKHFANIISQTEKKENPQRLHIPRYSSPVEPKKKCTVYYADNNVGSCVFAVFSPPCKEVFVYQQ